jgi:hypothetical protein
MTRIRLALPPVLRVQPQHQRQGRPDALALGDREPRDLDQQPLPQPALAQRRADRVQRRQGQQPHPRRVQPGLDGN